MLPAPSSDDDTLPGAQATDEAAGSQFLHLLPTPACLLMGSALVFTLVNSAYQDLFPGRTLLRRIWADAMPEMARQALTQQLYHAYETGTSFEENEVALSVGPVTRYVSFRGQVRRNAAGRVDGLLVFAQDVTDAVQTRQQFRQVQNELVATRHALDTATVELQRAQDIAQAHTKQLSQELAQFEQVLGQTPAMVALLYGPDHRFTFANQAFQHFFPDRQLIGRPYAEALPEVYDQGYGEWLNQVYTTGETLIAYEMPLQFRNAQGREQKAYFDFIYESYGQDSPEGLSLFAFDATERVTTRQQRATQQRMLLTMFEQAPAAIALLHGPNYIIEMANASICAMWGREMDQVMGRPLLEVLPEIRDQGFQALLDGVRTTGTPFVAYELPAELERQGRRETVYFNFVYQPIRDAHGIITSVAIIATDVSPQVAARQQMEDLNQELAILNAQLQANNDTLDATNTQLVHNHEDADALLHTASHELQAPLTEFESFLQLLQKEFLPDNAAAAVPQLLHRMQGSVEHFQHAVQHLKAATQPARPQGPAAGAGSVAAAVRASQAELAAQLQQAGGQLEVQVEDCAAPPLSEKDLHLVVYNLLSNALKYRHPDRPPQIRIGCRQEGKELVLEVQDNGLGLDLSRRPPLFQLFQRFHTHVEGSGVGLYLVKKLVEQADGRLQVRSQVGVGSTFSVHFPNA